MTKFQASAPNPLKPWANNPWSQRALESEVYPTLSRATPPVPARAQAA